MSVRTDVINLNVNVNGNKAQDELNKMRKAAADVKFEMEGLKKGSAEYLAKKAEFNQMTKTISEMKKEMGIAALTQKELVAEIKRLNALKGSVTPFSKEFDELAKKIKTAENRLYDVRNGVQGLSSFLSKIKDELKQFGVMAAGYLGFQFITTQFQNIIRSAGKMSDSLADIQRVTGMTSGEVKELNNGLKQLDTRTSSQGLREIAIVAGKLGVASEDILEFTKATDMLVVALGDELGNADQITTQLGKILNVFDGKVTGEGLLNLGNAMVELANAGVASGGFIADFTQRLSGIAKTSNSSLPAIVGLGAGLEELGARVESSSTAVQKLLISIAQDIPKAAKVANVEVSKFADTFAKAPEEALIQFAEGLVKNKDAFNDIATGFKDAGEEGARTVEVLSAIGQRGDFLREKISLAARSMESTNAITEAFTLKNNTLGASIDKLGKEFNRLVTSPGVTNFLSGATEVTLKFMQALRSIPWPVTVAAITALTGLVLAYTAAKVKAFIATARQTAAELASAAAKKGSAIATALLEAKMAIQIITTDLLAKRITIATAAQRALNLVMSLGAGGIGLVIAGVSGLVYAIASLATGTQKLTAAQKVQMDLQAKITELTGQEEITARRLYNSIVQGNLGYDQKQILLKQLVALSPEYLNRLNLENITTKEGAGILDNYIVKLREANTLKAKNQLIDQKELRKQELQTKNAELKTRDDVRGNIFKDIGAQIGIGDGSAGYQLQQNRQEIDQLDKELTELYKGLGDTVKKTVDGVANGADAVGAQAARTIEKIRNDIKKLDDDLEKIDVTDRIGIKQNRTSRDRLQNELNDLLGIKSSADKKFENDHARLEKEAAEFYKKLQQLKEQAQIKGEEPEQREVDAVEAKYKELTERAKQLYIDSLHSKDRYSKAEIAIEEAKQIELNNIFQKYFKKRQQQAAEGEYESALQNWQEYIDDKKQLTAKDYADGKINQAQYSYEIEQLNLQEKQNLVLIAQDYVGSVKKAESDLKKFRKDSEKETTDAAIKESERRKEFQDREKLAGAQGAVYRTRPGSDARLQAQKNLLQTQFELETQYLDKRSKQYLAAEAKLQADLAELQRQHNMERIENIVQYIGFFQDALSNLEQFQKNREQKMLNDEKRANDERKSSYKKQLDSKLISQTQYNKKIEQADAELDKRTKEIQREQAKREKALNIFNAIVNTAVAVTKALASSAPPYNFILAAAVGVAGALQIAAVSNAPMPQLGTGKWLRTGPKHKDKEKGTPVLIERDEAVMAAAAMTDPEKYTVTGTTAQITSALNKKNGGVSWAGGAVVKMANYSRRASSINPEMPRIMEQGGVVRSFDTPEQNFVANDLSGLQATQSLMLSEMQNMREDMKNWNSRLHAVVSIKEYREKEKQYDNAKKASGLE